MVFFQINLPTTSLFPNALKVKVPFFARSQCRNSLLRESCITVKTVTIKVSIASSGENLVVLFTSLSAIPGLTFGSWFVYRSTVVGGAGVTLDRVSDMNTFGVVNGASGKNLATVCEYFSWRELMAKCYDGYSFCLLAIL